MFATLIGIAFIYFAGWCLYRYCPSEDQHAETYKKLLGHALAEIEVLNKSISAQSAALLTAHSQLSNLLEKISDMEESLISVEEDEDDDDEEEAPVDETTKIMFRKLTKARQAISDRLGKDHALTKEIESIIDESQA